MRIFFSALAVALIALFQAAPADAFCTNIEIYLNNYSDAETMVFSIQGDEVEADHQSGQTTDTVPPGGCGYIETCPTAWFMSNTTYAYTVKVYDADSGYRLCEVGFTTVNLYYWWAGFQSWAIDDLSGQCDAVLDGYGTNPTSLNLTINVY